MKANNFIPGGLDDVKQALPDNGRLIILNVAGDGIAIAFYSATILKSWDNPYFFGQSS